MGSWGGRSVRFGGGDVGQLGLAPSLPLTALGVCKEKKGPRSANGVEIQYHNERGSFVEANQTRTHHHDRGLHFARPWPLPLEITVSGVLSAIVRQRYGRVKWRRVQRFVEGQARDTAEFAWVYCCRRPGSSSPKVGCPKNFKNRTHPSFAGGA